MASYTQIGGVAISVFQWLGGSLLTYSLPTWTEGLALQTPGDGTLHVPVWDGVFRASITDWVMLGPDGRVYVTPNSDFSLQYGPTMTGPAFSLDSSLLDVGMLA